MRADVTQPQDDVCRSGRRRTARGPGGALPASAAGTRRGRARPCRACRAKQRLLETWIRAAGLVRAHEPLEAVAQRGARVIPAPRLDRLRGDAPPARTRRGRRSAPGAPRHRRRTRRRASPPRRARAVRALGGHGLGRQRLQRAAVAASRRAHRPGRRRAGTRGDRGRGVVGPGRARCYRGERCQGHLGDAAASWPQVLVEEDAQVRLLQLVSRARTRKAVVVEEDCVRRRSVPRAAGQPDRLVGAILVVLERSLPGC